MGARARVPLPFVVPSSLVLTLERRLVTILRVCMNFEKKNHFNYQIKHKYNVDFHFKIVICLQYFSVHNKHFTLLFIVFFKCLLIMHLSYYLSFSTNIFSSKKHCCVDCNVLHVENFCVYVKRAVTSRQSTQTWMTKRNNASSRFSEKVAFNLCSCTMYASPSSYAAILSIQNASILEHYFWVPVIFILEFLASSSIRNYLKFST